MMMLTAVVVLLASHLYIYVSKHSQEMSDLLAQVDELGIEKQRLED